MNWNTSTEIVLDERVQLVAFSETSNCFALLQETRSRSFWCKNNTVLDTPMTRPFNPSFMQPVAATNTDAATAAYILARELDSYWISHGYC